MSKTRNQLVANLFGFYNPKQLADFLDVPHQKFYTELKDWSIYHVKRMLLRFMVKKAAEELKPVMSKSAATRSRAGMSLSIDNSVMDRFGKLIRCTYSWYSGRYHNVIRGQDLLGIVLTINKIAFPVHLLFCPKQGRYHTKKADLLIFMLKQLKTEFGRAGMGVRLKLTPVIQSRLGFHRVFQAESRKQIENLQNLSKLEKQACHAKSRRNSLDICLDQHFQCVIKGETALNYRR